MTLLDAPTINLFCTEKLMTVLSPYYDIGNGAPEISPIGAERMLQIRLNIAAFGCLNLVQVLGRLLLIIERGQQAGLHLDAKLLHLLCIQ